VQKSRIIDNVIAIIYINDAGQRGSRPSMEQRGADVLNFFV
jgi:hypothetical protein